MRLSLGKCTTRLIVHAEGWKWVMRRSNLKPKVHALQRKSYIPAHIHQPTRPISISYKVSSYISIWSPRLRNIP